MSEDITVLNNLKHLVLPIMPIAEYGTNDRTVQGDIFFITGINKIGIARGSNVDSFEIVTSA